MKITQIRSACIKLNYADQVLLIDPWLQEKNCGRLVMTSDPMKNKKAGPLSSLPYSIADILQDVTVCLVTHLHFDHFSPEKLPKNLPIIFQNRNDYEIGLEYGFCKASYFKEEVIKIGNITIFRVDGQHGDTPEVVRRMGKVSGYLLTAKGEPTVYIAGDTIFYEGVQKTIEQYHPDVIVVNACEARILEGRLIMDTADVEKVCQAAPESIVIASHMDQVNHGFLTREGLKQALEKTPYIGRILIPEDGETLEGFEPKREDPIKNLHVEYAKRLRNETPMNTNCSQCVLKVYAEETGITAELASKLGGPFGGGMRCGATCGTITGGLMVLGLMNLDDPAIVKEFRKRMAERHNGMTDCAELLRANIKGGKTKKEHCDSMIYEAIEVLDEMLLEIKNANKKEEHP